METLNSLMEIPWVRERSSIFLRAKILVVFLTNRRSVVAVCAICRLFNILALYVEKKHRGRGVGKKILKRTLMEAQRQGLNFITLGVYSDNLPALYLYLKFGFQKILCLEDPKYIIMMLPLTNPGKFVCYLLFVLSKLPQKFLTRATELIENVGKTLLNSKMK